MGAGQQGGRDCARFHFCGTRDVPPLGVICIHAPFITTPVTCPKHPVNHVGSVHRAHTSSRICLVAPRGPVSPSCASWGTNSQDGHPGGSSGTLAERVPHSTLQGPSNGSIHHSPIAPATPRPTAPGQPVSWPSDAVQGWGEGPPPSHRL